MLRGAKKYEGKVDVKKNYEWEIGDGVNADEYGDSDTDDGDDKGTLLLNPNLTVITIVIVMVLVIVW